MSNPAFNVLLDERLPQGDGLDDGGVRALIGELNALVRVARDIGSRVRELDRGRQTLVPSIPNSTETSAAPHDRLKNTALFLINLHAAQPSFGAPTLLDNRSWLLILELFVADRAGAKISVKEASLALGCAPSTALRKLLALEIQGVLVSREDLEDGRRRLIGLSSEAADIVTGHLQWVEKKMAAGAVTVRLRTTRIGEADAADDAGSGGMEPRQVPSESNPDSLLQ